MLGIESLKDFNQALLQKLRWRFKNYEDALWVKVIKVIQGIEVGFGVDGNSCKIQGLWAMV